MADRKQRLTLLFEVDTSKAIPGMQKAKVILEGQVTATENLATKTRGLTKVEERRYGLLKEVNRAIEAKDKAYQRVQATINKINSSSRELNKNLDMANATRSVEAYNRRLETVIDLQRKINVAKNLGIKPETTRLAPTPITPPVAAPSFSFISGSSSKQIQDVNTQISKFTALTQDAEKAIRSEANVYKRYASGFVGDNRKRADAERELTETIKAESQKRITSAEAESRGYVPYASGTVGENRAKADAAQQEEYAAVEARLAETRQKADDRENARILHNAKLKRQYQQQDLAYFSKIQVEKQTRLQESISRQIAVEQYGAKSIQVARIDAANRTRALQSQLAQHTEAIQKRMAAGTINVTKATELLTGVHSRYRNAILKSTQALNAQEAAHRRSVQTQRNLFVKIGEIIGIYRAYVIAITLVERALTSIPKTGIQYEQTVASLTASFKNAAAAQRELIFLNQEAERTGIALSTLRESYADVAASFIGAGQSAETTRKIFQNINTVSTTLHLRADQTSRVYLALSQIFNKTKLQAEELTKQLSQTIPGATQAQAEALGITVAELYDRMKEGSVSANEAILALSETLAETYGGEAFIRATSGMNAAIGRTETAWTHLAENIYKGSSEMLISILKLSSNSVEGFAAWADNTYKVTKALKDLIATIFGLVAGYAAAKIAAYAYTKVILEQAITIKSVQTAFLNLGTALKANIFSAAIIAAGTLTSKFINLRAQMESLDQLATDIERRHAAVTGTVTQQLEYKVETDVEVQQLQAAADEARARYELYSKGKLGGLIRGSAEEIQKAYHTYNVISAELEITKDKVRKQLIESDKLTLGKPIINTVDRSEELAKIEADYISAVESKIEGAQAKMRYRYRKIIATFKKDLQSEDKTIVAQAKDQLARIETIIASAGKGIKASRGGGGAAKDFLADLQDNVALASKAMETEQAEFDRLYKYQAISIEEYFAKKAELINKDLAQQIEAYTIAKEYAEKIHDTAKVIAYGNKLKEVLETARAAQAKLQDERLQEEFKFNDLIAKIQFDYAKIVGDTKASELAIENEINLKYKERESFLAAQVEAGRTRYEVDVDRLQVIKQHEVSLAKIATAENQAQQAASILQATEERIRTSREAGFITEKQATQQIIAAREQYIQQADQMLLIMEKQAALNKDDLELQLKVLQTRQQIASVKYAPMGAADSLISGGQTSFIDSWQQNKEKLALERQAAQRLAASEFERRALQSGYNLQLQDYDIYRESMAKADSKYNTASAVNHMQLLSNITGMASDASMEYVTAMQKMYGANSKEAKRAFMVHKAFAVAQATINTALGFTQAIAQGGIVGIITGAIVLAAGAAQIAQIVSQPMPAAAAHGGMDYVPKEQTILVDKGERIISPKQNKDLTSYLNSAKIGQSEPNRSNLKIINAFDSSYIKDYLGSDEGEEVILNVVRKDKEFA